VEESLRRDQRRRKTARRGLQLRNILEMVSREIKGVRISAFGAPKKNKVAANNWKRPEPAFNIIHPILPSLETWPPSLPLQAIGR
jgi:hypothetical protein